jgi:hypothetical protein
MRAAMPLQELKELRRAGCRTFAEAEAYEAGRRRRALEERGGSRGDRAHARHPGRPDADDAAVLAQVLRGCLHLHACW